MHYAQIENQFWNDNAMENENDFDTMSGYQIAGILNRLVSDHDEESREHKQLHDELIEYILPLFQSSDTVLIGSNTKEYGDTNTYVCNIRISEDIEYYSEQWRKASAILDFMNYNYKFLRSFMPKNSQYSQHYIESYDKEHRCLKYYTYNSIGD